jgi:hypothetical protein
VTRVWSLLGIVGHRLVTFLVTFSAQISTAPPPQELLIQITVKIQDLRWLARMV